MRTFIAIRLPDNIRTALARLQNELKKSGANVNWVNPKNIHLTLKFLGEVNEDQLTKIADILERVARDNSQFEISLSSCEAFPNNNFPRVIWVGLENGDNETKAIAEELEKELDNIGIPKEKRAFSSHITIGRIKSDKNKNKLYDFLNELKDYFGKEKQEFNVTGITLLKSTLRAAGPIYEVLKETNLNAT